ncbi:MAG: tetratricopeptide repeat protein [Candidatus Limnocylindrales bacterium]
MADPIFERYKEALRAGHVAALRGRPDEALAQYRAAAAIGPDRTVPHSSMAEVLLLLGRTEEALVESGEALRLGPDDPTALEIAARVREHAGEPGEAAVILDRLVEVLSRAENFEAGCAAAVRARDLQPTERRRMRAQELEAARESASGVRPLPDASAAAAGSASAPEPGTPPAARAPAPPPVASVPAAIPPVHPPAPAPRAEPALDVAASADGEVLAAGAERLAAAGDPRGAARLHVRAADACLARGASATALDECLQALMEAPGDTAVYLALARIHVATGHPDRARATLELLERFLELDHDQSGLEAVVALRNRATGAPGRPELPRS